MISRTAHVALAGFASLSGLAQAVPSSQHRPKSTKTCPSFNSSTFVIDEFQLYPENAKFDFNRCLVYFGYVLLSLDSFSTVFWNSLRAVEGSYKV